MSQDQTWNTLERLIETRLVSKADLLRARSTCISTNNTRETDSKVIELLLRDGVITKYQLSQLAKGRRNFFCGRYRIMESWGCSGNNAVLSSACGAAKYLNVVHMYKNATLDSKNYFRKTCEAIKLREVLLRASTLKLETDSEYPFFAVQQNLRTQSLKRIVQKKGALPMKATIAIAYELLRLLNEYHTHELLHGDVNPGVIFVDSNLQIAQLLPLMSADRSVGNESMWDDFCPPERYADLPQCTKSSDVYQAGATIYYAVTGRVPYYFIDRDRRNLAVIADYPYAPHCFAPDIPHSFEMLISEMLNKTPEPRPTAKEAVELLAQLK